MLYGVVVLKSISEWLHVFQAPRKPVGKKKNGTKVDKPFNIPSLDKKVQFSIGFSCVDLIYVVCCLDVRCLVNLMNNWPVSRKIVI